MVLPIIEIGYIVTLVLLTVYSYTQVDLNLTLSSNAVYQSIQQQLTYIGYFNRPVSGYIFIFLLAALFFLYFFFLRQAIQKKISKETLIRLIGYSVIFLPLAYPAFSHDLFNYMFDARILTTYGLNPYEYKALDFPDDLWTRFMHWTHRTYPYGPVWLLLTMPFSYLGLGKFVPTLLLFKLMFAAFHIGNIYLIYRILKENGPKIALGGVVFFALNPLILIESLVSAHNEVVMLFFLLLSMYFLFIKKQTRWSLGILMLSIGTKFVTGVVLPVIMFLIFKSSSASLADRERLYKILLVIMGVLLIPLVLEILYREPYPWYFIPLMGVGALLVQYRYIRILLIGTSLAFLLRYAPFLSSGEYGPQVWAQQSFLSASVMVVTCLLIFSNPPTAFFRKKRKG